MEEGDALHVLVSEDDSDLRSALVELLESEGIDTTHVSTLDDARGVLTRLPDAVLLLDVNFRASELTAVDWLTELLRQNDAPRTLLLSASHLGPVIAQRFGVPFIRKPFDFDDLLRQIRDVRISGQRPRDSQNGA